MRHVGSGVAALALLGLAAPLGATEAAACGWLWPCADRPHVGRAYRDGPRAYGYGSRMWAPRYRGVARGYAYTGRSWTSGRWYLGTALPATGTGPVGLTALVVRDGQVWGGMPAEGPTLFGPQPASAWGYAYGPPAYGYRAARSYGPPRETPSWWVEPRRRP